MSINLVLRFFVKGDDNHLHGLH